MELFKLLGTIAIDTKDADSAIDSTTKKAKQGESEQSKAFSAIGTTATTVAKGIGVAGLAIGGAFIGAVEGTREYRTEMGKLDTAFVINGHSSEVAKQTYSELNSILGDSGQAVEASQHLAVLTDNEKDLQTWTDICTGVYATFGEAIPIEGLTEASNETAKTGALTGGLVDALNWAGISEEEFQGKLDKCSTEQERQKLIMDTLNETYKDASNQYKETNKDVIEAEKAQERLTDAMAKVGTECEPIMNAIKNAIAGMAEKAVPVIQSVIDKVKDMATWFKDNEEKVKLWGDVILIATSTVAGFILVMAWSSIMTKASNALNLVTVAVKALNVAMKANVIGLVVTAIIGLVTAFIYLWNNCESFRNFWINLWNKIVSVAKSAWSGIKNTFSAIGSWFKEKFTSVQKSGQDAMNNVKKFFSDAWNGIKNVFGSIGTWFGSKFQGAWSSVKNAFSGWTSFFSGLWTGIKNKFSSIGTSIGNAVGSSVKSGVNGVISSIEKIVNGFIGQINGAIGWINKIPNVNISKIAKVSFGRLAEGGIVDKATASIIGEDGAEAVIPLERNIEWIDKVANRLNQSKANEELISRMNIIIDLMGKILGIDRKIYLDSGALVGELSPAIDHELGRLTVKKNRRNI